MCWRIITRPFAILTLLMGVVCINSTLAQETKFNARVFPIFGSKPMLIEDFNQKGLHSYEAFWGRSSVELSFQDIKTIRFLNPGKWDLVQGNVAYNVEVTLNDGSKDTFALVPKGRMYGKSKFGSWSMRHIHAAKIELSPSNMSQVQADAGHAEFDRIVLKNGDEVTGQVQTAVFKLRTSYGTLNLETAQVSYVDFEGGGPNRDVIVLRIGDRLSGVIEVESIQLLTSSGAALNIQNERIKRITFKK